MENYYVLPYKVILVREVEHPKNPYSKDELTILLRQPEKDDSFVAWRTWAIINWVLSLGSGSQTILFVLRDIQRRGVELTGQSETQEDRRAQSPVQGDANKAQPVLDNGLFFGPTVSWRKIQGLDHYRPV